MFKLFKKYPFLISGLSTKASGTMGLSFENTTTNFIAYFKKQGIENINIVRAGLVHGDNVVKVGITESGQTIPNCDGLLTDSKNLFLSLTVADCYPIYFFNRQDRKIGLIHCGWRGAISPLIKNMVKALGPEPNKILVGVGPGIELCHFEVRNDIIRNFENFPEAIRPKGNKVFIDLPLIIKKQLMQTGITPENIEFIDECTYCDKAKYFSYRRDKPTEIQTMVAYIGL